VNLVKRNDFDLMHFIGHGEDNFLVFADGQHYELKDFDPICSYWQNRIDESGCYTGRVKMLVLNCCMSYKFAKYIYDNSPIACVIGTTDYVFDKVAAVFSSSLFESLCNGKTLKLAFADAVLAEVSLARTISGQSEYKSVYRLLSKNVKVKNVKEAVYKWLEVNDISKNLSIISPHLPVNSSLVAVFGGQREGKSTLLNLLARLPNMFKAQKGSQACTKGVWFSQAAKIEDGQGSAVMSFVDHEGQGNQVRGPLPQISSSYFRTLRFSIVCPMSRKLTSVHPLCRLDAGR
jgi:hypothetical protein